MFLFIVRCGKGCKAVTEFKYISCSYLSVAFHNNSNATMNLNTSHVLIYPTLLPLPAEPFINLNTSHVLIYQNIQWKLCSTKTNLNTSHVLIYHFTGSSIILIISYLNTSHVLIYLPTHNLPLSWSKI